MSALVHARHDEVEGWLRQQREARQRLAEGVTPVSRAVIDGTRALIARWRAEPQPPYGRVMISRKCPEGSAK